MIAVQKKFDDRKVRDCTLLDYFDLIKCTTYKVKHVMRG